MPDMRVQKRATTRSNSWRGFLLCPQGSVFNTPVIPAQQAPGIRQIWQAEYWTTAEWS
jgi:hypothetical protein